MKEKVDTILNIANTVIGIVVIIVFLIKVL